MAQRVAYGALAIAALVLLFLQDVVVAKQSMTLAGPRTSKGRWARAWCSDTPARALAVRQEHSFDVQVQSCALRATMT